MQQIVIKQLATFSSNTSKKKYNMLSIPVLNCVTARNTEILPIFLVWIYLVETSMFRTKVIKLINKKHCVKSVRIRSYSGQMRENNDQNNFE